MTDDFFETTFRSSVDAPPPDPAFVADLRRRIEAQWGGESQEDIPVTTMIERPAPEAPEAPKPTRLWMKYAAAAAAVAVIGAGAILLTSRDESDTSITNPPVTTVPEAPPEPEVAGSVTTSVPVTDGDQALGLTATGDGLFYTFNGEIVRLDPEAGTPTARLRVADANLPDRRTLEDELVAVGERLFVGLQGIGIVEVDPSGDMSVVRRYDVPNISGKLSVHVVVTPVSILTTRNEGNELVRIDRATGAVSATPVAEGETLHALGTDGESVFATYFLGIGNDVMRRLDPITLEADDEVELTVGSTRAIVAHEGSLFVTGDREANGQGSLVKVDAGDMSVVASTPVPGEYPQYPVVVGDTVWVGNLRGTQLGGVDVETGELAKVVPIEKSAYRVAPLSDGKVMWFWAEEGNTLFRIDLDD